MRAARQCQHPIESTAGPIPERCDACLGPRAAARREARRRRYTMSRQGALRWYPRCGHVGAPAVGGHPWAQRCPACRAKAASTPAPTNGATPPVVTDWAWQPPGLPAVTARPTPWRDRAYADSEADWDLRQPQRRLLR